VKNKIPLVTAIVWFVVGSAWAVILIKDLAVGGGSATPLFGLVTAVSWFAAFTNFRRYKKLK
jgi:hypothetical protein